jgi:hypothetical protein
MELLLPQRDLVELSFAIPNRPADELMGQMYVGQTLNAA